MVKTIEYECLACGRRWQVSVDTETGQFADDSFLITEEEARRCRKCFSSKDTKIRQVYENLDYNGDWKEFD